MTPDERHFKSAHTSPSENQLFVNDMAAEVNSRQFIVGQACKLAQPHVRSVVAFFLISACGFLVSCSTPGPFASSSAPFPDQIKTGTTVCLLPPKVTYERTEGTGLTERDARTTTTVTSFGLLNPDLGIGLTFKGERGITAEAISNDLARVAGLAFQAQGAKMFKSGELAEQCPHKKVKIQELISDTENLLRGMKPAQTLTRLRSFSDGMTNMDVLVLRCTILVGPERQHEQDGAARVSPINRAIFKAVVLRPDDGQVVWQNEVLLRDFPDVNHRNYQETLSLLFPKPTIPKAE